MRNYDPWTVQPGDNLIERISTDSSLTISFDTIFRDIDKNLTVHNDQAAFDFCGCGWPHHMLVPIGTEGGYPMEMFVMITNHAEDLVRNKLTRFFINCDLFSFKQPRMEIQFESFVNDLIFFPQDDVDINF